MALKNIQASGPDIIDDRYINFDKMRRAAEVIKCIRRPQRWPYQLQPDYGIASYLDHTLSGPSLPVDETTWNIELSISREP